MNEHAAIEEFRDFVGRERLGSFAANEAKDDVSAKNSI